MNNKIRVLVVDDSAFARSAISKMLSSDPEIEVIGTARDGEDALKQVEGLNPDVITLDVSMPRMDGIVALDHIMSEHPTPVVMLSALTGENTHATLEALEKGAVDFFLKPSALSPVGRAEEVSELLGKIRIASKIPASKIKRLGKARQSRKANTPVARSSRVKNKVLVIGSSTGGPKALAELIPGLPADIPASILLIQHMPAGFTRSLAERLDNTSAIGVKEAEDGDLLTRGQALMAPGGYHMVVTRTGEIKLNQNPPVCGVRPSVDVTMKAVAEAYGQAARGVVLTGMGSDGTEGSKSISKAGGSITVEHESTCAVYGMPKSVVDAGFADRIAPLRRMADEIVRMCGE